MPRLAVFIIFIFLPSNGPSYIHLDYMVNPGIEPTPEDHGSDCESTVFTTRPGNFPYETEFY